MYTCMIHIQHPEMRLIVLSDLHLERPENLALHYTVDDGKNIEIDLSVYIDSVDSKRPDIICLCGDIGDPALPAYAAMLTACAKACRVATLVILGNHECYGRTHEDTIVMVEALCRKCDSRLIFLDGQQRPSVRILDYMFIGTTLWSSVLPEQVRDVQTFVSDFRCIKDWDVIRQKSQFQQDVSTLRRELAACRELGLRAVVLTHHVPLINLGSEKHQSSNLKSAFCSDLSTVMDEYRDVLRLWLYGHDHHSSVYHFPGSSLYVVSNQFGTSPTLTGDSRFRSDLCIDLSKALNTDMIFQKAVHRYPAPNPRALAHRR